MNIRVASKKNKINTWLVSVIVFLSTRLPPLLLVFMLTLTNMPLKQIRSLLSTYMYKKEPHTPKNKICITITNLVCADILQLACDLDIYICILSGYRYVLIRGQLPTSQFLYIGVAKLLPRNSQYLFRSTLMGCFKHTE